MTVSDPINTLPLNIKRNKISVTRPFQYTSVFPVLGDKVHFPLARESVEYRDEKYERKTIFLNYSPVALYTTDNASETYPTNVPEKVFKLLNTNARTFKRQRQRKLTVARQRTTLISTALFCLLRILQKT